MAKKTSNKSQLIRDYIQANPESSNKDILEALSKSGVKYHDVANVRNNLKKDGSTAASAGTKKRGRPPKSAARATELKTADNNAYDAGVRFVQEAGGVEQAMEVLQVIQRISQMLGR